MGTLPQAIQDLINEWKERRVSGDPRALALVFTKLQEAQMWAEKV